MRGTRAGVGVGVGVGVVVGVRVGVGVLSRFGVGVAVGRVVGVGAVGLFSGEAGVAVGDANTEAGDGPGPPVGLGVGVGKPPTRRGWVVGSTMAAVGTAAKIGAFATFPSFVVLGGGVAPLSHPVCQRG